jgi:hypothetical protein
MHVQLHVEQIFKKVPIYHVAVGYKVGPLSARFDFHPKERLTISVTGNRRVVSLGKTNKNIMQVLNHEQSVNKNYFLFINDCRHYSNNLIKYSLPKNKQINTLNPIKLHLLYTQASEL